MATLRTHRTGTEVLPVDYHMHTTFSDGKSDIAQYIEAAEDLGLTEIAITDHCWRSSDWIPEYVDRVQTLDSEHPDVTIHAGLEAKIIDRDGTVDVAPDDAEQVDFVMGVVHRYQPEAEPPHDDLCNFGAETASALERDYTISLAENPTVDVIGHPSRTYYKFHYTSGTPHYPDSYYREMIDAAKRTGTLLEYNARLPVHPRRTLLSLYVDSGIPFTIGSDAHEAGRLANLDRQEIAAGLRGDLDEAEPTGDANE